MSLLKKWLNEPAIQLHLAALKASIVSAFFKFNPVILYSLSVLYFIFLSWVLVKKQINRFRVEEIAIMDQKLDLLIKMKEQLQEVGQQSFPPPARNKKKSGKKKDGSDAPKTKCNRINRVS